MTEKPIRILFLADTHLGFDMPFRPRVERRRRGPDFFEMFELALEPAYKEEVDLVVHGGDILYRSKVPPRLVQMAFEPLKKAADHGLPVVVVPGNHERSAIPFRLWASHPNIHIFVRPKTFYLEINGAVLALAGFPYERDHIRATFPRVIAQTGWEKERADASILCMHHIVEGAALQMGSKIHVFRDNPDVIGIHSFPPGFAAVLSGHIHRFQVLSKDLRGFPAAVPVFYPGSTERTSFVEKDEAKGYLILEIEPSRQQVGGILRNWHFRELPARPMVVLDAQAKNMNAAELKAWICEKLANLPANSVVQIRIQGNVGADTLKAVSAESLRSYVPASLNVSVSLPHPPKDF